MSGSNDSGYRGCQTKTRTGRTCQKWTSQKPHPHGNGPSKKPGTGVGKHNYCRNPDGSHTIWCYTTDSSKRREYCDPLQKKGKARRQTIAVSEWMSECQWSRPHWELARPQRRRVRLCGCGCPLRRTGAQVTAADALAAVAAAIMGDRLAEAAAAMSRARNATGMGPYFAENPGEETVGSQGTARASRPSPLRTLHLARFCTTRQSRFTTSV